MPVKPKVPKTAPKTAPVEDVPEEEVDEPPEVDAPIELVDIPFRGQTFQIPRDMDEWDIEACLALSQHNYAQSAKLLLGTGQWALLQSLGSKRKDINDFLVVFGRVIDRECTG